MKLTLETFLNALITVLFCYTLNSFIAYEEYTLAESGKWQSTKAELKKGCGAAWAYLFTKTALSENRLNISCWNGYHELIYKQPVQFGSASFKYYFNNDFFSFVIDKTDSLIRGVSFHFSKPNDYFVFTANSDGQFIEKKTFQAKDSSDYWNEANIERQSDSLLITINGKLCFADQFPLPDTVHFGLKGGSNMVVIDNIAIKDTNKREVLYEDFSPSFEIHFIAILLAILLTFLIGKWLLKIHLIPSRLYFHSIITLGVLIAYYVYYFYLSGLYPLTSNSADWHGMKPNIDGEREVCAKLNKNFPIDSVSKNNKVVLFLGSSQTWGSGATNEDKTMPALVEENLKKLLADSSILAINCGIAGFTSNRVYDFYSTQWYKYNPALVVINLSTNDGSDTTRFKKSMEQLITFNRRLNIPTLLIQEPNSYVTEQLLSNHATLQHLSRKYSVPTLTMQEYMDSLAPNGFLWWDYVHCTNYGYQLMSERITPKIVQCLQANQND